MVTLCCLTTKTDAEWLLGALYWEFSFLMVNKSTFDETHWWAQGYKCHKSRERQTNTHLKRIYIIVLPSRATFINSECFAILLLSLLYQKTLFTKCILSEPWGKQFYASLLNYLTETLFERGFWKETDMEVADLQRDKIHATFSSQYPAGTNTYVDSRQMSIRK